LKAIKALKTQPTSIVKWAFSLPRTRFAKIAKTQIFDDGF